MFAHPLLELLQVPENIIGDAKGYLRIIFLGLFFTFIYNFFSNTLRALGDSKGAPLFSDDQRAADVIGDLFFVVVLGWGCFGKRGCDRAQRDAVLPFLSDLYQEKGSAALPG